MTALVGMTQAITVTRSTSATDAEGRPNSTGSTVATVNGLVTEMSATEQPQGGSLGQETTAQAIVPLDTDIAAQDVLSVSYGSLSRSYRVVAVHDAVEVLLVDLHRDG